MNRQYLNRLQGYVGLMVMALVWSPADAAVRRISQDLPIAATIVLPQYTTDGRWITYRADIEVDNRFELYVIDRDNDFLNQKVNVGDAAGAIQLLRSFDNLVLYSVGAQMSNRLFASRLPLSSPVELTPVAGEVTDWLIFDAKVNASQSTVVFVARREVNGVEESIQLYSVPLTGGPITRINAPLDNGSQGISEVVFLNDDEVIYRTAFSSGSGKLYRASIDGSSAVQISLPSDADSDVREFRLSSSGEMVVYRGDLLSNEQFELFATHLPSSQIERISLGMSSEEDVIQFSLFGDSDRVVYEVGNSFVSQNFLRTRSLSLDDTQVLQGVPDFEGIQLTQTAVGRVIYTSVTSPGGTTSFDHRTLPISGGQGFSLAFPFSGTASFEILSPQTSFVAMGFIRFSGRRELFINRSNGSGLRQLALGDNSVEYRPVFTVDDSALVFSQVDGNVQELMLYDTASQRLQVLDRVEEFGQLFLDAVRHPTDPNEVIYRKNVQTLFEQPEIWVVSLSEVFSDGFE